MKLSFLSLFVLVSIPATAAVDCEVKIVANGKASEEKIEMKEVKAEQGHLYQSERDGYLFQAETNDVNSGHIYKLIVMDKASKRRSNSRYSGMKPAQPNAYFSTALVLAEGEHAKTAQLNCRFKK